MVWAFQYTSTLNYTCRFSLSLLFKCCIPKWPTFNKLFQITTILGILKTFSWFAQTLFEMSFIFLISYEEKPAACAIVLFWELKQSLT